MVVTTGTDSVLGVGAVRLYRFEGSLMPEGRPMFAEDRCWRRGVGYSRSQRNEIDVSMQVCLSELP